MRLESLRIEGDGRGGGCYHPPWRYETKCCIGNARATPIFRPSAEGGRNGSLEASERQHAATPRTVTPASASRTSAHVPAWPSRGGNALPSRGGCRYIWSTIRR